MNIQSYFGAYAGYNISAQMQQMAAEQAAVQGRQDAGKSGAEGSEAADKGSKNLQDIWKELGKAHNVTNMSLESLRTVSLTLHNNDKVTIEEHTVMNFSFTQDQADDKQGMFRTEADEDGKRDWIAEFKARLEEHQAQNNEQAAAMDKRILSILERLQAAASGGLNVTV